MRGWYLYDQQVARVQWTVGICSEPKAKGFHLHYFLQLVLIFTYLKCFSEEHWIMDEETHLNTSSWTVFLFLVLFVLAVPVRSEGECLENKDCPSGSYCKKVDGDCNGTGTCEEMPGACIALVDPVCGCDDVTYSNSCEAALQGISVMYNGTCQGSSEASTSVQGAIYDKWEPWNDTLYVNLENCNGLSDAIANLENELVTIQVGPFSMEIPGSDFVLTKTGYFLYYHPGKMAGEETAKLYLTPVSENISFYCGNTKIEDITNPITVELAIGGWACRVTGEWEEMPYSAGVKYVAR